MIKQQLEEHARKCHEAIAINAPRPELPEELTDLSGADLIDAELSCANLSCANLSGAYLSGANLIYADLSGANLIYADLSGADLIDAELIDAELIDADLSGADLSGADLSGANLIYADLSGADLSGANLIYADLIYADLSGATGLPIPKGHNALALRSRVADQIEQHPATHDQTRWGEGDPNECGTPCCVAGWACRLGGGNMRLSVPTAATLLLHVDGLPTPSFHGSTTREEILSDLRRTK